MCHSFEQAAQAVELMVNPDENLVGSESDTSD